MVIRYAQKSELYLIQKIAYATWPIAYGNILSDSQLSYMLKMMYDLDALLHQYDQLKNQFLLAFDELGNELGFASFSKNDEYPTTYKLHKLYVLPHQQGKKIGKLLLDFVVQVIKKTEEKTVIKLNVNRQNNAVTFYIKQGFKIVKEEDNDIGEGYFMNDYLMQMDV